MMRDGKGLRVFCLFSPKTIGRENKKLTKSVGGSMLMHASCKASIHVCDVQKGRKQES